MIIDFHTHIFPDKIAKSAVEFLEQKANIPSHSDGTLSGLKESMGKAYIDYSVILPVATKPTQVPSINKFAEEIMNEKGIISFGGMHPEYEDYRAELKRIKDIGLKGIKLHPDYQGFCVDDENVYPMIEYAASLDLIIVFHSGLDLGFPDDIKCTAEKARKLIDKLKYEKLVFAHLGGYGSYEESMKYLVGQNIYLDTSYSMSRMDKDLFLDFVKKHGEDKILFATDSPWDDQSTDVNCLKNMPLSNEAKERIFYKNAAKLLGI